MPAINRFDCPPSIGIGARHPSDYAAKVAFSHLDESGVTVSITNGYVITVADGLLRSRYYLWYDPAGVSNIQDALVILDYHPESSFNPTRTLVPHPHMPGDFFAKIDDGTYWPVRSSKAPECEIEKPLTPAQLVAFFAGEPTEVESDPAPAIITTRPTPPDPKTVALTALLNLHREKASLSGQKAERLMSASYAL